MARRHKKKAGTLLDETLSGAKMNPNSTDLPPRPLRVGTSTGENTAHTKHSVTSPSKGSADLNPRPAKRVKAQIGDSVPPVVPTDASTTRYPELEATARNVDATPVASSVPLEVQHLRGQYTFSTMSIISSSKINHKVKTLIECVEKFTFANVHAKPGIVVLTAKAAVASKMISVVEIAKGDIARRGGKWYEYSKLRSELLEMKPKPKQRRQGGRTLADTGNAEPASEHVQARPDHSINGATSDQMDIDDDDLEDGGVAFESMQPPVREAPAGERPKVRATPLMIIYFSCVPIPGLKDLYGWVIAQGCSDVLRHGY